MIIKKADKLTEAHVTNESYYFNRRQFISGGAAVAAMAALPAVHGEQAAALDYRRATSDMEAQGYYTPEKLTPYKDVTHYNNFYEFGTSKTDPANNSKDFVIADPWKVEVDGLCENPGNYYLEDILQSQDLEERIYRLRCVEAWSMVIPWVGFSLSNLINKMAPTSKAKYVAFTSLYDPQQMPGQRSSSSFIDWPYVEGLRLDEAMNPLTMMVTGVYGKELLPANGAPLRLVVPWKYGYKSAKSIVKITFTEQQPPTSWNQISSREYGFYSNVNPNVRHPRWSQATERRLPSTLFSPNRIDTQMYNGYGEQVAHLYKGMDLIKNH